jgi:hypothetical protein
VVIIYKASRKVCETDGARLSILWWDVTNRLFEDRCGGVLTAEGRRHQRRDVVL